MFKINVILLLINYVIAQGNIGDGKLKQIFSWKQIGYDIHGVKYRNSSDHERRPNGIIFDQDLEEEEKFFIQYNNVPIGLQVYADKVFVTVPRRKYGIPSTLNYVDRSSPSPLLMPYPSFEEVKRLVSVYRPAVDECDRLWMVDTGLLEVPGARKQLQPPAILAYDLPTGTLLFRYEFDPAVLINERTSGGLTSITIDVERSACDDAYAYVNDLATEGLVVFSLKQRQFWRINHPSFSHDESAMNFTAAGSVINWKDGVFSIALSETRKSIRTAYYHPLVSTHEFSIDTRILKQRGFNFNNEFKDLGTRGPNTQSSKHVYHAGTRTLFFGNVAQDAILCWNVDVPLTPANVGITVQDHQKLVYISDMILKEDEVWVLANQIPRFVYSSFDVNEDNYFILSGNAQDLIRGTVCDK
ncbi:hypothetical protein O3G_MSEX012669 [Manduca sexta]|uniref:Dopachrome conversion enzyme 1 n=1 Tax=Manduca sexta TaxID=7130 RepID=A0A4P8XEG5_MANSE|nr:hypothetical protein O3G_MSEX012669 [Manduca sexta]QCS90256.1 dopachrome conversion enzyme 1 [Manduca sexta]